ncbi:UbiA family prenyltransferase [Halobacteriales archaeon Cl-PHB]
MSHTTSPQESTATVRSPGELLAALVHSALLVSVAAASVAVTTMALAGFAVRPEPPFLVFGATLLVYSLDRVADVDADARTVPSRVAFVRRYGQHCLLAGGLLYAAGGAIVLVQRPALAPLLLLPLVAIGLYAVAGLKRRLLVKNAVVGASWGLVPLGVGRYLGDAWRVEVLVLAGWVTWHITVAAMVFDLKDVAGDRAEGVRTVPTVSGPATTRRVAQVANAALATLVVATVTTGLVPHTFLVLLVVHGYVAAYVAAASIDRGPLFYGLVVDGEHALLAALALAVT